MFNLIEIRNTFVSADTKMTPGLLDSLIGYCLVEGGQFLSRQLRGQFSKVLENSLWTPVSVMCHYHRNRIKNNLIKTLRMFILT